MALTYQELLEAINGERVIHRDGKYIPVVLLQPEVDSLDMAIDNSFLEVRQRSRVVPSPVMPGTEGIESAPEWGRCNIERAYRLYCAIESKPCVVVERRLRWARVAIDLAPTLYRLNGKGKDLIRNLFQNYATDFEVVVTDRYAECRKVPIVNSAAAARYLFSVAEQNNQPLSLIEQISGSIQEQSGTTVEMAVVPKTALAILKSVAKQQRDILSAQIVEHGYEALGTNPQQIEAFDLAIDAAGRALGEPSLER